MSTNGGQRIARGKARAVDRAPLIPLWALLLGSASCSRSGASRSTAQAYVTSLLGKFLCFAIFALSIDLIWGFAGILSLGQAVYFGIGAYFVALSLKINYAIVHPTRYGGRIPGFHGVERPDRTAGFHGAADQHAVRGRLRAVVPTLLAFMFGVITFKRHIYGVYCAVITLAESLILQEFIIEYQAYTGGFNGITDYSNYVNVYFLWFMLAVTVMFFVAARALTHSRDRHRAQGDPRQRRPRRVHGLQRRQLSHLRVLRVGLHGGDGRRHVCGLGGLVSFLDAGPVFSVEAVIWTAVGGRATLIGPFLGAFLVRGRSSS